MDRETQSRIIEFLLTYGWAVLVLFVALGALIFFGLFPEGAWKPSSCSIDPRISCDKWGATSDGNITVALTNNFEKDLTGVTLKIGNCSKTFDSWNRGTTLGGNLTTLTGCSVREVFYKHPITITYKSDNCIVEGELSGVVSG